MNKICFMLLCVFSQAFVWSQNSNIKTQISEPIELERDRIFPHFFIEDSKGGTILIYNNKKDYSFAHYDNNLEFIGTKTIEKDKKENVLAKAYVDQNKLYLIERVNHKKSYEYYSIIFDVDNYSFDRKLLFSIPNKNNHFHKYSGKTYDKAINKFKFSNNKEYLIYSCNIDNKKQINRFYVFNKKLELQYKQDLDTGIKDIDISIDVIALNENSKDIYVLAKKLKKESIRLGDQYELYNIGKNKQKKSLSLISKDRNITDMNIIDYGGEISLVGLCGEKVSEIRRFSIQSGRDGYDGIVKYNINGSDFSIAKTKFYNFTDELFIDMDGEKHRQIFYLVIREIKVVDGETFINGEIYSRIPKYNGPGESITYGDIVSAKINEVGDLIWSKEIHKYQTGLSTYHSYSSLIHRGTIYYFFNSNNKIKTADNRPYFKSKKNSVTSFFMGSIDSLGSFNYQKIVDGKEEDLRISTYELKSTKKTEEMIFLGTKKEKLHMVKIKL